jgi:hypothetical protein
VYGYEHDSTNDFYNLKIKMHSLVLELSRDCRQQRLQ